MYAWILPPRGFVTAFLLLSFYAYKKYFAGRRQLLLLTLCFYLVWYNTIRIKVSLGNKSPVEYRQSLGINA